MTRHGVRDACADPDLIRWWWHRWPTANVGLACGRPGPDVLDVDTKHGAPGARSYRRLRDVGLLAGASAVVETPSGGWHLYYDGSDQRNGSIRGAGVDFRSRGGYVLAPPSVVDGRWYRLMESRPAFGVRLDWSACRDLLAPPRPVRVPVPRAGDRSDHAALVRWVARQPEGGRNNALFWATRRAVETGAADDVYAELVSAAVAAGLGEVEAARTVRSARDRGRGQR